MEQMNDYQYDGEVDTCQENLPSSSDQTQCQFNLELMKEIKEDIEGLKDLFYRRLSDDKQKAELIRQLENESTFAFIEPFLSDIILLLDRMEKSEDEFVVSVKEELYEILHRRGVSLIQATENFDPTVHRAIKTVEKDGINQLKIVEIIRNGYVFSGKVLRPAEVVVAKPRKD